MSNKPNGWVAISSGTNQMAFPRGVAAATLCLGLLAGTGGDVRREQVLNRLGTGSVQSGTADKSPRLVQQGVASDLSVIRTTLRLSIAELAELFGVSRPTIYSWQSGNKSAEANAKRVRAIALAIDVHDAALAKHSGRIARRAIEGSATLLDLLRQGRDPSEVIGILAVQLDREVGQRERLTRRLQGRTRARGAADTETFG